MLDQDMLDPRQFLRVNGTRTNGSVGRLNRADILVWCLSGAVTLFSLLVGPGLWIMLVDAAVFLLFVIYRFDFGHLYFELYDQFLVEPKLWLNGGKLWANPDKHGKRARSGTPAASPFRLWQAGGRAEFKRRWDDRLPFTNTWPIKLAVNPLGPLGVIHGEGTDSIVITADGSYVDAGDYFQQNQVLEGFEDSVRDVAVGQETYRVKCTTIRRRHPIDRWRTRDLLIYENHPAVGMWIKYPDGKGGTPEEWEAAMAGLSEAEYERYIFVAHDILENHMLSFQEDVAISEYIVWTIKAKFLQARRKGASLTAEEFSESAIADLIGTSLLGLETKCGVINPRVLDLAGTRDFVASGLNLMHADKFHRWRSENPITVNEDRAETRERLTLEFAQQGIAKTEAEIEAMVVALDSPHWPDDHMTAYKDSCDIDETFWRVIRIKNFPRLTMPDFFSQIVARGVQYYSYAAVGETANSRFQVWLYNVRIPLAQAFGKMFNASLNTPAAEDRRAEIMDSRQRFHESKLRTDMSLVIAVPGYSRKDSKARVKLVGDYAKVLGLKPQYIKRRSRQLRGTITGTLGISQL
jgi:hypothetical protein